MDLNENVVVQKQMKTKTTCKVSIRLPPIPNTQSLKSRNMEGK